VQFDLDPVQSEHIIPPNESPNASRDDISDRHHDRDDRSRKRRRRRGSRSRSQSPGSEETTETEELPARFDSHGRRIERGTDPFADKLEDLLHSNFFQKVTDDFLGAGGSSSRAKRG